MPSSLALLPLTAKINWCVCFFDMWFTAKNARV